MARKTNPRRRPMNQADVLKAKEDATSEAISYALALFFTVLADKEHAQNEDLMRIWNEINELSQSVIDGYVTIPDLINVLKQERGIHLK